MHLHHPKGQLFYIVGFGMVLDKAALYPPMQCLPIWGDDGNRLFSARVATITYNEIYWMKVQSLFVSAAVLQKTGFMQKPRISHKIVEELALLISHCLLLYGWEELKVYVLFVLHI